MKRTSGQFRKPHNLSDSSQRRLNAYAVAAGATGVGLLALAQPSEAKIVYTPANIPIVVNSGLVEVDLNHDGINDFQFYNSYQSPGRLPRPEGNNGAALRVQPTQTYDRVWAVDSSKCQPCAAALPKGTKVGPHGKFQAGHSSLIMAAYVGGTSGFAFGPWLKVKQAFVGLKFVIKGKTHFGWARIRMGGGSGQGFGATITGYAYETVPKRAIMTGKSKGPDAIGPEQPKPASLSAPSSQAPNLGLLALGSGGLSVWRRD